MAGHCSSQRSEVGTVVGQANRGTGRVPDQQRLDVMAGVGDPGPDAIKLLVRNRLLVEVGVAAVELTPARVILRPGWSDREGGHAPNLVITEFLGCLLYTSPSPRDGLLSRMPSSA